MQNLGKPALDEKLTLLKEYAGKNGKDQRLEIYDQQNDPGEYNNLAFVPDYRQTSTFLLEELQAWMSNTDDFPPTKRTRRDHTDRITGIRYYFEVPELENDLLVIEPVDSVELK